MLRARKSPVSTLLGNLCRFRLCITDRLLGLCRFRGSKSRAAGNEKTLDLRIAPTEFIRVELLVKHSFRYGQHRIRKLKDSPEYSSDPVVESQNPLTPSCRRSGVRISMLCARSDVRLFRWVQPWENMDTVICSDSFTRSARIHDDGRGIMEGVYRSLE